MCRTHDASDAGTIVRHPVRRSPYRGHSVRSDRNSRLDEFQNRRVLPFLSCGVGVVVELQLAPPTQQGCQLPHGIRSPPGDVMTLNIEGLGEQKTKVVPFKE